MQQQNPCSTVVLEFNCDAEVVQATVWLYPMLIDENTDEFEHLPDLECRVKLIGPVDYDTARNVFESINSYFSNIGMNTRSHVIADD
jgi:hypothetical protein